MAMGNENARPATSETYLGDGLYCSFDGFMFTLRAPRDDVDHWVGLEPEVLKAFLAYAEAQMLELKREDRPA
jgi:hypothetical protein